MNQRLKPLNHGDFDLFYDLMRESFPQAEFRSRDKELDLLNQMNFTILSRYDQSGKALEGFIAEWSFHDFLFIEHFAVQSSLRGHGIGSHMLSEYLEHANKPVLIEVETPTTDLAKRRIHFYERLGFTLSEFGYIQPDLQQTGEHVHLLMMQYPTPLTEQEFLACNEEIFRSVYETAV
ncbi:GNAT family N-acetyltransferase [Sporolactobacillus nakayamae]|uniref:Ribosomal protein S18 acetylase RimI n=1 Tax=Sporolactobacillus nakayamae TaxID=269670 RepID=A0A1I2UCU5_9BACL|nr:GNAT family N-acetyltransferase [Sporolactobacillus nakayamae]SFG72656.1 Ribosomal protein S18 acetylase RimI [Sporolactobacillus nakayamae]